MLVCHACLHFASTLGCCTKGQCCKHLLCCANLNFIWFQSETYEGNNELWLMSHFNEPLTSTWQTFIFVTYLFIYFACLLFVTLGSACRDPRELRLPNGRLLIPPSKQHFLVGETMTLLCEFGYFFGTPADHSVDVTVTCLPSGEWSRRSFIGTCTRRE